MSIENIIKNDLCLGCGLCSSLFQSKIEVTLGETGFFRPKEIDPLSNEETELLNIFCPGINLQNNLPMEPGFLQHPIWGNYHQVKTGYSMDKKIREQGSSGGVLTALGTYLVETGQVDVILHAGPATFQPALTEYKISSSRAEAISNAGSRYAPSATLINLDLILDQYSAIAIIAKPCEVAAVRKYQTLFPEKGKKIKYLLSFFCAGVPSIKGTQETIKRLGVMAEEIATLRYRGEGWPGYFKVSDKNGIDYKMTYNDSWGKILNRHLQFRCKICPDGTGEQADIVCADAWEESEEGYPSFEQRPGQSLIITRTGVGTELLSNAINAQYVCLNEAEFDIELLKNIQPYQFSRKANITARVLAMKLFFRAVPTYQWNSLIRASREISLKEKVRNFLGTAKRLAKNK